MDSNRRFHNEHIKFCAPDGTQVTPEDALTLEHVLVMPEKDNYTASDINEDNPLLVKLDQQNVEWMPIVSTTQFLVLRFTTGSICLISNAYGIRALVPTL